MVMEQKSQHYAGFFAGKDSVLDVNQPRQGFGSFMDWSSSEIVPENKRVLNVQLASSTEFSIKHETVIEIRHIHSRRYVPCTWKNHLSVFPGDCPVR